MTVSKANELKEKGNECLKNDKYAEAVFTYTHAIKLNPTQYQLYSNRSLAFLKLEQYYYAREDALESVRLNPKWSKGYFRKGEAEFHCGLYTEALSSYRQALHLTGEDCTIMEAIRRTKKEQFQEMRADAQVPWVGAGFGFVFGVLLVIGDEGFLEKPYLFNPLLKLLVILLLSAIGFILARLHRRYLKQSKRSLLDPPINLFSDEDEKELLGSDTAGKKEGSTEEEKGPKLRKPKS